MKKALMFSALARRAAVARWIPRGPAMRLLRAAARAAREATAQADHLALAAARRRDYLLVAAAFHRRDAHELGRLIARFESGERPHVDDLSTTEE